jgi:hypothetical protein
VLNKLYNQPNTKETTVYIYIILILLLLLYAVFSVDAASSGVCSLYNLVLFYAVPENLIKTVKSFENSQQGQMLNKLYTFIYPIDFKKKNSKFFSTRAFFLRVGHCWMRGVIICKRHF